MVEEPVAVDEVCAWMVEQQGGSHTYLCPIFTRDGVTIEVCHVLPYHAQERGMIGTRGIHATKNRDWCEQRLWVVA